MTQRNLFTVTRSIVYDEEVLVHRGSGLGHFHNMYVLIHRDPGPNTGSITRAAAVPRKVARWQEEAPRWPRHPQRRVHRGRHHIERSLPRTLGRTALFLRNHGFRVLFFGLLPFRHFPRATTEMLRCEKPARGLGALDGISNRPRVHPAAVVPRLQTFDAILTEHPYGAVPACQQRTSSAARRCEL